MFAKLTSLFVISLSFVSLAGGKDVVAEPEDTDVHLFCSLTNPKWEKDNKTIEDSNRGYTLVSENGALIVHKVDNAHMGVYVCRQEEPVASETIVLFVRPHVKPYEKSSNMIQEDPLQLECKGYGYPIPVVEWYTKGKLLVQDGVRITLKDTPAQSESSVMINGTIRITNMDFDDAGDYECVAENVHGKSKATISVNVKDKLAAILRQEEERADNEESERLNANNESKGNDDVRQRK